MITFANEGSDRLAIYWLKYNGEEKFYRELLSGESYQQRTFITHPWRVRDAVTGRSVQAVTVTTDSVAVVIDASR